jgi:hypothetical protein
MARRIPEKASFVLPMVVLVVGYLVVQPSYVPMAGSEKIALRGVGVFGLIAGGLLATGLPAGSR